MDRQLNARRQKTRTACVPCHLYTSIFANRVCLTFVVKTLCGHSLWYHVLLQSTDNMMLRKLPAATDIVRLTSWRVPAELPSCV